MGISRQGIRVVSGLLLLSAAVSAKQAEAVDYVVTDEASCEAFGLALGVPVSSSFTGCQVEGGDLPAGDTVTFSGDATFRPQGQTFTNFGDIIINSTGTGFYGAANFINKGVLTIVAADSPQNYGVILNEGTFSTSVELFNGDEITNACGGVINGTFLGESVVQQLCPYTIGGSVSGLLGSGLSLLNNGGDTQTVSSDGAFSFSEQLDGEPYDVTVGSQPVNPDQVCVVSNGQGVLAGAAVSNVQVQCTVDPVRSFTGTTAVPAAPQWALLIMAAFLGGIGIRRLRAA